MKTWKVFLYSIIILMAIILLPVLILISPILLVIHLKKKKVKKQTSTIWEERIRRNQEKHFSTPYKPPKNPLPDDVFIERIEEFTCLQFCSRNDYTGGTIMQELVASENPEKKERVLEFLRSYPIAELLHGERYQYAMDVNHWEFRFIFEESDLNRSIFGYGQTELTAPYLQKMCSYLPEILTEEEQWHRMVREENIRRYLQEIKMGEHENAEQEKHNC